MQLKKNGNSKLSDKKTVHLITFKIIIIFYVLFFYIAYNLFYLGFYQFGYCEMTAENFLFYIAAIWGTMLCFGGNILIDLVAFKKQTNLNKALIILWQCCCLLPFFRCVREVFFYAHGRFDWYCLSIYHIFNGTVVSLVLMQRAGSSICNSIQSVLSNAKLLIRDKNWRYLLKLLGALCYIALLVVLARRFYNMYCDEYKKICYYNPEIFMH